MSQISLKSITGITSITTPTGVDNQFTLHTNNTNEALKLDGAGNLHFHNHLNITGVSTASNFKTGTSNLHNTGLNVQDLDVDGHTNLDNVSIAGVTTTTDHIYIDADNKKLNIGDGSDLQLYHTGARSEIINNTGDLVIQPGINSSLLLRSQTGAAHFKGVHAAQVELYWNGNKRLETSSVGVSITKDLDVDGHTNLDNVSIAGVATVTAAQADVATFTSNQTASTIYVKDTDGDGIFISGSSAYGHRIYTNTTEDLRLGTNSNERLRITSDGKVLVGDGSAVTPSRNLDVRGAGHQQILLGSTDNSGVSLMLDGHGNGDGSGGNYGTVEMGSDGHLDIRNYDPAKNIVFGVGSNTGAEDTLILKSNGDLGLSNTGTNNPNNYNNWCTFTINGTAGAELDFERAGTLYGDIFCSNTNFAMTTRDSSVDINFATKNNGGSTANRLTINSEGSIQHKSGSGVSYFNGASEYVFGSTGSSPASGGAEGNVQIHAHKTRAQFSINAYMNNAGGPYMQLVSSRSGTVGTLGTAAANNDGLGAIRFSADDGNGGVVYGAEIAGKAKSAATTNGIAGRLEFFTTKDSSSSVREVFSMNEGGAFTAESESPALYGYITSLNNGNKYVDFPQWTRDSFICLEIFGSVNPNSAGSGNYLDPVHMYVYRGVGWTGSRNGYYIYSVSVAPPARHAFPSGTGYSGNAQISAVWTDGSSNLGNETATSTNYMRLLIPNANNTYSFQKQFRIFRRR